MKFELELLDKNNMLKGYIYGESSSLQAVHVKPPQWLAIETLSGKVKRVIMKKAKK